MKSLASSVPCVILLAVSHTWVSAQQPRASLREFKGTELLQELRLREAVAVKLGDKDWAKGVRTDSLYQNVFVSIPIAELKSKSKASSLKGFASAALFDELHRRARKRKGVFGSDDRQDLFRLEAQREELAALGSDTAFLDGVLGNAKGVCCLVNKNRLSETPAGTLRLSTTPYAESQHDVIRLCVDERFYSQPVGASCTGFLVAADIVVTAGHCVNADTLGNVRFVFGYRMTNATTAVTTFPKADVYSGSQLIGRKLDDVTGEDWAIVRLDRVVAGVTPLKFRRQGQIPDSSELYVIGFPSGLPCKVAANAKVSENANGLVFASNLDTYAGNSGSPVFNRITHEVEGILVRGGKDFQYVADGVNGCIRSVVLADTDGKEECTRATVWAGNIPQ